MGVLRNGNEKDATEVIDLVKELINKRLSHIAQLLLYT